MPVRKKTADMSTTVPIPKTRLSVLSHMQIKGLKRHTRHTKQKPIIQKFIKNTR